MIEHRTVVNLIYAQSKYFEVTDDEKILQFSNYSFDASVEQIFLALFNGASLVLFPDGLQLNIELFEKFLLDKKVTHLHATPSFLENINPDNLNSDGSYFLKRVIAGGDVCKKELAANWRNKVTFINEYGPTETTVTAIEYKDALNNSENISSLPIGKALSNIQVYILDKNGSPVPVGVEGELYLGGDCLARGYLNSPELTSEKFIKNPFIEIADSKMYKTGDLCKWLNDGNIEYIGRIDDQVKIRGYRIELGEIESVLQENENVRQCAVLAKQTADGNRRLTGYVVSEGVFDKEEIMTYLSRNLPVYMIPSIWVELESLPLTSNGKIDKKKLPDPDADELLTNEFTAPESNIEKDLAMIWKELLHVERVGIHDNFFELGGDSIITIQLVSRARRFGYEVKPKDIFIHQTISALSLAIKEHSPLVISGEQGMLTGECGLTPIQNMYFEEEGFDVSHFNQSVLLGIEKEITSEELKQSS
jgi:acyl-coenzyme A synthetase/AMP-(fatty) acid ligase/aryl carrier-like protein